MILLALVAHAYDRMCHKNVTGKYPEHEREAMRELTAPDRRERDSAKRCRYKQNHEGRKLS